MKVNPRALAFYERHGFRRTGESETHYLLERYRGSRFGALPGALP